MQSRPESGRKQERDRDLGRLRERSVGRNENEHLFPWKVVVFPRQTGKMQGEALLKWYYINSVIELETSLRTETCVMDRLQKNDKAACVHNKMKGAAVLDNADKTKRPP
ncbi:hypothetical protein EVAR_57949_1 [Eumeta japonica]|uniref:Uncharacterized protein n=1 Tax=Eumeta variegata TaxID=151549 RepID=A0A4C1XWQ8_EUMVA|nr:hypothetical protein EVAR_57949_1 [Eumeta japonica]